MTKIHHTVLNQTAPLGVIVNRNTTNEERAMNDFDYLPSADPAPTPRKYSTARCITATAVTTTG
jgi:hypothetical protein